MRNPSIQTPAGGHPPSAAFVPGVALRAAYGVYQVLLHLGLPLVVGWFLWLSRREPAYRARLWERFGLGPRTAPGAVWVYAVSIGEMRTAAPLIRRLLGRGLPVLLTSATPDGLEAARQMFGPAVAAGQVRLAWVPIDLGWAVGLFLRGHRPRLGLIVDAEIWPAQVFRARARGVPLLVLNGNLSAPSLARNRASAAGRLRLRLLQGYALVLTRSPAHVARYIAAGVDPARLVDTGDLKADVPPRARLVAAARHLRPRLTAGGGRVVALVSTARAEHPALVGMVQRLRARLDPPPSVVWVPRNPQDFAPLAARLRALGLPVACRSAVLDRHLAPVGPPFGAAPGTPPSRPAAAVPQRPRPEDDGRVPEAATATGPHGVAPDAIPDVPGADGLPAILLGDSLGEMDFYLALADVVFVGGSLHDEGGHNILEALALEKPVLSGPSMYRVADSVPPAQAAGALRVVADVAGLEQALADFLTLPAVFEAFAAAARGYHDRLTGASDRAMAALWPWLGDGGPPSAPEGSRPAD